MDDKGDRGGAYEHRSERTGSGARGGAPRGEEHMEGHPPAAGHNEIEAGSRDRGPADPDEVRRQGRTRPHGPETRQDTRVSRKSGA